MTRLELLTLLDEICTQVCKEHMPRVRAEIIRQLAEKAPEVRARECHRDWPYAVRSGAKELAGYLCDPDIHESMYVAPLLVFEFDNKDVS